MSPLEDWLLSEPRGEAGTGPRGIQEWKWVFPKIRGTILGVPVIRTIVFWALYWGPPILGKYQMVWVTVQKQISEGCHNHENRPCAMAPHQGNFVRVLEQQLENACLHAS